MNSKEKPSKKMYAWAALILVGGIVAFNILILFSLFGDGEERRVIVPGMHELVFEEEGNYTIFYEYKSIMDGRIFSTGENITGFYVTLRNQNSNQFVELEHPSMHSSYNINGREGVAVFQFMIDEIGMYELQAWYEGVENEKEIVLSVKEGGLWKFLLTTIVALLLAFSTIILAGFLFIRTYLRRKNYSVTSV